MQLRKNINMLLSGGIIARYPDTPRAALSLSRAALSPERVYSKTIYNPSRSRAGPEPASVPAGSAGGSSGASVVYVPSRTYLTSRTYLSQRSVMATR